MKKSKEPLISPASEQIILTNREDLEKKYSDLYSDILDVVKTEIKNTKKKQKSGGGLNSKILCPLLTALSKLRELDIKQTKGVLPSAKKLNLANRFLKSLIKAKKNISDVDPKYVETGEVINAS